MLIFTNAVNEALQQFMSSKTFSNVAVVADANTARLAVPQLDALRDAALITIGTGDKCKNLETLVHVWQGLERCGATRQSLVVNVGGGVVTDLGGMAAATFKRGVAFANVPTTLLSAVDASVGGKTGINFNGLKNEVGLFREADCVIISSRFLETLPLAELKSGYAEMVKHGMLKSHDEFARLIAADFTCLDREQLLSMIETSVRVKQEIVSQDPHEHGLRRALNLGHTAGHAIESHAMTAGNPIPHGYAVAWGLVVEMVLSHMTLNFPSSDLYALAHFVRKNYGVPDITCQDYTSLLQLMRHDKKSERGEINCTLLSSCGEIRTGQTVTGEAMQEALDIFRDLMGM